MGGPMLFTWDLRLCQLTNSYFYDRSAEFMAWDASTAWIVLGTALAGFLNWCFNRSVWLAVRQFLPGFAWQGAWLLIIKRWPSHYKRNRQPLVLIMRCGMLMSEARAIRDGGDMVLRDMVLRGIVVEGWPRLTPLAKVFMIGLVPYTCLQLIALQSPFAFQLVYVMVKLFFACHNESVQNIVRMTTQPQFGQAADQLLKGWLDFLGQNSGSTLLQHDSISSRTCNTILLYVVANVTVAALLLWCCYLFSLVDILQWLRKKEELALCEAAASGDRGSINPSSASIMIGSVWVTAEQLADTQDSAFIDALLAGHPSEPVVTLMAHVVMIGCICCGSCLLNQLLVLQLLPRFASEATLDLYCPKLI